MYNNTNIQIACIYFTDFQKHSLKFVMSSEITLKPKLIFNILDDTEQAKSQILADESLVYITFDEYQQTILHLAAELGNADLLNFIIGTKI